MPKGLPASRVAVRSVSNDASLAPLAPKPSPARIASTEPRANESASISRPSAAASSIRTPSTPPSRKSRQAAVPARCMNPSDRSIAFTRSSREAARSSRCFSPSGGATSSSSERPPPASLAIESPMWVWALTNAGRTMSSLSTDVSSMASMRPSSSMTTRPRRGRTRGRGESYPFVPYGPVRGQCLQRQRFGVGSSRIGRSAVAVSRRARTAGCGCVVTD